MGEGTGGVDRLPSLPGRGVGGEGVQLLSVNQYFNTPLFKQPPPWDHLFGA